MARAHEAIDELYALPLEEFTKARAKRAAAADSPKERAEIKALPKPTRAAWILDRLAREDDAELASLFAAGDALKKAQSRGDRAEVQEATRTLRARLAAVTKKARAAGANATTSHRVVATLQAALVDDDVRALVLASRLGHDVEVEGFGALAGSKVAAPRAPARAPQAKPKKNAKTKAGAAAEARARAAREKSEREAARAEQRRQREEEAKRRQAARKAHEAELAEAHVAIAEAERRLAEAKAKARALKARRR